MRHLLALAFLIVCATTAQAQLHLFNVAPAPTGNDANTCSPHAPCTTLQRAVDLCPPAAYCSILVAPGRYAQRANAFFSKVLHISGPMTQDGRCADRGAVVIEPDGKAPWGPAFTGQDHVVLSIACLTIVGGSTTSAGLQVRQFAIGDVTNVHFRDLGEGVAVSAGETSKINVTNSAISGRASRFALAVDLSQVTIGGKLELAGAQFAIALASSLSGSVVSILADTLAGSFTGAAYQCIDSTVRWDAKFSGPALPFAATDDCRVFGSGTPPIDRHTLLSGLTAANASITALRAEFEDIRRQLRAELEDVRRQLRANHKALRTTAFAIVGGVVAILVGLLVLGALRAMRAHRRRPVGATGAG